MPPLQINLMLFILSEFMLLKTLCTTNSINAGDFGAHCSEASPCDPLQNLACISGICRCESPVNQRYDNFTRKCLSFVGGPCTTSSSDQQTSKRKGCITNAHCVDVTDEFGGSYTECQCLDGFIENSVGDCVPGIGKPCSYQPNECNPLGMVVCKNGRCECLDELQVYDKDMKRCVGPAGAHCKYDSFQLGCVKNAICYPFFYWIPPKCLCKPGYVQTKSRECISEVEYNKNSSNGNSLINGNHFSQSTGHSWQSLEANQTVQI